MSYKRWIIIAVFLFSIGIALGLVTPSNSYLPSEYISVFEKQSESILTLPKPFIAIFMFLKNTLALLVSFALSPIFCLVPILALIINGWVIAFVSTLVIEEESIGFLLAGLLPHGIFELPALILGQAAALSFGIVVILALFTEEGRKLILPSLKQNLRYLTIALVLLLPAAVIETYVTPLLLG